MIGDCGIVWVIWWGQAGDLVTGGNKDMVLKSSFSYVRLGEDLTYQAPTAQVPICQRMLSVAFIQLPCLFLACHSWLSTHLTLALQWHRSLRYILLKEATQETQSVLWFW